MQARMVATCAVMTALLIALQCVFGMIVGVEAVTVFFLTFCYVFGAKYGLLTATAFSLLRGIVFGFDPKVLVLYLVYYNAFALLFGLMGRRKSEFAEKIGLFLLLLLVAGTLVAALVPLPVSALLEARLKVMLWALFGVLCILLLLFILLPLVGVKRLRVGREAATLSAFAAACTVCFTLLDDVITPFWYGISMESASGYFYTSFFAMVPQTLCAAVSVLLLFLPLEQAFAVALPPAMKKQRRRPISP